MSLDLVLKNGLVLDPQNDIVMEPLDVGISNGRIASVGSGIAADGACVIDASGLIVLPGLIDFHAHFFHTGSLNGLRPGWYPATGVTGIVDAGSAGISSFAAFYHGILSQCGMTAKAMLNLSAEGLSTLGIHPENINPRHFDCKRIVEMCRQFPDTIFALKIRISADVAAASSVSSMEALEGALELAESAGLPLCVHMPGFEGALEDLVATLRPNDIFCHVHTANNGILRDGAVASVVREGRSRGILYDTGCGRTHLNHAVAKQAILEGFLPDTISGDLTANTWGRFPVVSLPYILSHYLALGMPLLEVIRCCTQTPARLMGLENKIGSLTPGANADIAVMRMEQRSVEFQDYTGDCCSGNQILCPVYTFINGEIVFHSLAGMGHPV